MHLMLRFRYFYLVNRMIKLIKDTYWSSGNGLVSRLCVYMHTYITEPLLRVVCVAAIKAQRIRTVGVLYPGGAAERCGREGLVALISWMDFLDDDVEPCKCKSVGRSDTAKGADVFLPLQSASPVDLAARAREGQRQGTFCSPCETSGIRRRRPV